MLSAKGAAASNVLAKRFALLRAWIAEHPDAGAKLRHLDVHFAEWDAYEDESLFLRDPSKLQGFEAELAQCEDDAKKLGYVPPGGLVNTGGVVQNMPDGPAAQWVSDEVAAAEWAALDAAKNAAKKAGDATDAIPWYAWALGGLAVVGLGFGAAIAIQNHPAVAFARSLSDNPERRRSNS